ncbi:hypothetical protein BSLG_006065 [Batrachochytrium salamandrivorans]|nr:hypothetical protein BSLG_006065 [Batrachochytrium salamandrivorans]
MEDLSSAAEKISAIYEELTLNTSAAIDACNDDDLKTASSLHSRNEGSKGLLACQAANTHLDDMISELETTTIFAQAKQLDSVDTTDNFSLYKDQLLLSVEKLTDLIDGFSKCNKLTQDELALMLNESVSVMKRVQGKCTKGNSVHNIQRHDDSQRASRTDNVIEEINSACQIMNDKDAPALGTALPEEIISFARTLTGTAAAIIGAATISSKQETLAPLMGNLGKVINELARAGKLLPIEHLKKTKLKLQGNYSCCGNTCKDLIVCVKTIHAGSTADAKCNCKPITKNVTTAVTEVVSAAGKLVPGGYVDPNDPNVITERKLLSAAIAIEQAAKRLAEFKPAEGPRKANMNSSLMSRYLKQQKRLLLPHQH